MVEESLDQLYQELEQKLDIYQKGVSKCRVYSFQYEDLFGSVLKAMHHPQTESYDMALRELERDGQTDEYYLPYRHSHDSIILSITNDPLCRRNWLMAAMKLVKSHMQYIEPYGQVLLYTQNSLFFILSKSTAPLVSKGLSLYKLLPEMYHLGIFYPAHHRLFIFNRSNVVGFYYRAVITSENCQQLASIVRQMDDDGKTNTEIYQQLSGLLPIQKK